MSIELFTELGYYANSDELSGIPRMATLQASFVYPGGIEKFAAKSEEFRKADILLLDVERGSPHVWDKYAGKHPYEKAIVDAFNAEIAKLKGDALKAKEKEKAAFLKPIHDTDDYLTELSEHRCEGLELLRKYDPISRICDYHGRPTGYESDGDGGIKARKNLMQLDNIRSPLRKQRGNCRQAGILVPFYRGNSKMAWATFLKMLKTQIPLFRRYVKSSLAIGIDLRHPDTGDWFTVDSIREQHAMITACEGDAMYCSEFFTNHHPTEEKIPDEMVGVLKELAL